MERQKYAIEQEKSGKNFFCANCSRISSVAIHIPFLSFVLRPSMLPCHTQAATCDGSEELSGANGGSGYEVLREHPAPA